MENRYLELKHLGWSNWFEERVVCSLPDTVARVAAVDHDLLLLIDQTGYFRAKLAGSYLYRHQLSQDLPCVGDWVCVEKKPGDTLCFIHTLIERRTQLRRKSAGDSVEYQMIAANMDYVLIVQSCSYDFNMNRLERYLVMVRDGGAEPHILLTKTDLIEPALLEAQILQIHSVGITTPILALSNVTQEGVADLRNLLLPGMTYCLVGSSGVGKSTLINQLVGGELLKTKAVSGTGEGTHTTVRRELILLEGGALIIDNPGMREFGILGAEDGISESFSDITSLAHDCRYRDCTHTNEPGCAVREAVKSGEINQKHYENFKKLREESRFNEMSYIERRKKDRDFGKYIKSVKKDMRNR